MQTLSLSVYIIICWNLKNVALVRHPLSFVVLSGKRRYNIKIWKTFTDCFNCLPIAAIVDDKIFCCHGGEYFKTFLLLGNVPSAWGWGSVLLCFTVASKMQPNAGWHVCVILVALCPGLSPDLNDFDQIRSIARPTDVPDTGLLCDLLWSDPDKDMQGWGENDRGVSFTFGSDIVTKFLNRHDLDLICRAHQVSWFSDVGVPFYCTKCLCCACMNLPPLVLKARHLSRWLCLLHFFVGLGVPGRLGLL